MDEATLQGMIAAGESATVEFKIKAPRPAELAERICGMANMRTGGVIIFGVADATGELVGIERSNDTIDLILRATRMIKPPVQLAEGGPQTLELNGTTIVIAAVPANEGTLDQASGVFWMRCGSHTVPAGS